MNMLTPQQLASHVVSFYPRGPRGSEQNLWRVTVACYVQGAYGKKRRIHGLPLDPQALFALALEGFRRNIGQPEFTPAVRA